MDLHLTKKDFRVEWFSGTGGGGQYRNKHQNCCRITHIETGLRAQETRHRERPANQKSAFEKLARLILAHHEAPAAARREDGERVRTYHAVRNTVKDEASGLCMTYTDVVEKGNIAPMIDSRRRVLSADHLADVKADEASHPGGSDPDI